MLVITIHTLEVDGPGPNNVMGATFEAGLIILWLKRFQILDDGQSKFLDLIPIIVPLLQRFALEDYMLTNLMSIVDDHFLHFLFNNLCLRMMYDFNT